MVKVMPQNFVKIYTGSSITVIAIVTLLEEHNIFPLIKDRAESARLAGFGSIPNMQEVFVPQAAESKALELLQGMDL